MSNKKQFEDPDQRNDIMDIHDAAFRREEPLREEGNERGPWWLYAIIMITFAFGFFYIGFYWGDFSYKPHVLYTEPQPTQAQQAGGKELSLMEQGKNVYNRTCQTCHQADAKGTSGVYPPLAGSRVVNGNPARMIAIVLHGLQGELEIEGDTYNGVMTAWGGQLSDQEVAAVVSYVRSNFGNDASEVTADSVKTIRSSTSDRNTQWTIEELNQAFNE